MFRICSSFGVWFPFFVILVCFSMPDKEFKIRQQASIIPTPEPLLFLQANTSIANWPNTINAVYFNAH